MVKAGRYGPYVTTVVPEGSKDAPRTASLFSSMSPETVTLEDALKLLTLPRTVGAAPDGEEIQALNGRYGPYLKKGTDSRSLRQRGRSCSRPRSTRRWRSSPSPSSAVGAAAAAPLKELGADPVTQGAVTVREGRFGPYVTDGETNASLRKGDDVESITIERAAELLADRRARGPATKKKAAKKTTAKKTAAKKAAGQEGRREGGCSGRPPADGGRPGGAGRPAAASFGSVAAGYAALRPTYPADAVAFLLGTGPRRRCSTSAPAPACSPRSCGDARPRRPRRRSVRRDAGAAARRGCRGVRDRRRVGGVAAAADDGSVDAVVAGQAAHWFDAGPAAA